MEMCNDERERDGTNTGNLQIASFFFNCCVQHMHAHAHYVDVLDTKLIARMQLQVAKVEPVKRNLADRAERGERLYAYRVVG